MHWTTLFFTYFFFLSCPPRKPRLFFLSLIVSFFLIAPHRFSHASRSHLRRNNWWVGILAFGEGWHNNHHAFEYSARHGLEKHQVDVTWGVIWMLEKLGLAWDVRLPTEKQLAAKRVAPQTA